MMKYIKKWVGMLVVLSMVFSVSIVQAESNENQNSLVSNTADVSIPKVVNKYMKAINTKDWELFVRSYSPDRQKFYSNFPSKYQSENQTGILSVDSIEIYEMKELPTTYIFEIEPYFKEINTLLFENIRYYYIGFNYKVNRESEFFYNGVRYELMAIGNLDGTEYIIGHENVYDLTTLDKYGYTFQSETVKKAQNIVDQRKKGIIVNFNNEMLFLKETGKNGKTNNEGIETREKDPSLDEPDVIQNENNEDTSKHNEEKAKLDYASKGKSNDSIQLFSASNPPSTFNLYITNSDELVTIGFDDYAKQVLPNEWYASWEEKALHAGAMTIKTYAWYNVTYPRRPATDYGAHLTDNPDNYQRFVEDSNHPATDDAVDNVSGYFMRNSDGEVFDAQYRAGEPGEMGEAFGGVLYQWGTQYIATNYPEYDYYTILSYYYSFSDKSEGYIQVGQY